MQKIPVVFVTSVFGAVSNGPALYANILWEAFHNHDEIDFHIVTPKVNATDNPLHQSDQIHFSDTGRGSRDLYRLMQEKALEVCGSKFASPPLVHGNCAHTMSLFSQYEGKVAVQVNDYDAATVLENPLKIIRRYGVRRFLSLAWRNRAEGLAVRFSDKVICNSEFIKQTVIKKYGITPQTTEVIYKAVNIAGMQSSASGDLDLGLKPGRNILFLGSNWLGKGLDVAIDAISLLPAEMKDIKLVVGGGAKKPSGKIQSLIAKHGLQPQVQFLGNVPRSKVPGLMRQCELLVFPSHNEALGVAVLEALSTGLPVVASNVGGIPEILSGAQYSKLVTANDPRAFANAIAKTLESRDLGLTSATATESISIAKKFSAEKMTKHVEDMYLRVFEAVKPPTPGQTKR